MKLIISKLKHFYFNKYLLSLYKKERYHMSYDYRHKALWFRTYKVASRTIDNCLRTGGKKGDYIYGSGMSYSPAMFKKFFKFAFVRNPESRLISAWKDKVLNQNYFKFTEEEHKKMKDLDAFLKWVQKLDINSCDEHLRSQHSLIDINNIDFIGRLESFNRDFEIVSQRLGLVKTQPLHLNQTEIKNMLLTREQRLCIYKIYQKDFQIFYPNHLERLDEII